MDSRDEECSASAGLLHAVFPETNSGEGLQGAVARVKSALDSTAAGLLLLTGLHGGSRALMLAAWFRECARTGLVVTPDRESADQLADDLETWLGADAVVHLPQQEVLAFDHNSPEPALVGDFLTGLERLHRGGVHLVVTSVYALHCAFLPLAGAGLVAYHVRRARLDTEPADTADEADGDETGTDRRA